ncbi:MAG TPA: methylmalonyl Co-A mutase-associated GTPase MeaB [Flavobacteriales bacterium]|nr:methylmalonyl Co-A mutase-associated GTPase MeaB [Flavobacteriales bacterium]HIA12619.1 methylmalonyl Co-A mutase-associated GTPase MeaB [Flavobacteriales bacterium]HIO71508.1 methylmalonyl Co-A mutase-associated GTPase MeaB [Flavobacteriales bacterium]
MTKEILNGIKEGDTKALSRCISLVENESNGSSEILESLNNSTQTPVIGITGPPGAGKSTLINSLLDKLVNAGKKVGIICIDPTSPFNFGSLLADRLRMGNHFNDERVFIRSLATRGSLGGLSAKTIEVTDVMCAFGFDYVLVETVGVGQSEVEIAGLADTTVLVLVPESGDDIQNIKSGIMEIADIFVVNKADRVGADSFANNLESFLHTKVVTTWKPPVVRSVATSGEGAEKLITHIDEHIKLEDNDRKHILMAEKAYHLIQNQRMADVDKSELQREVAQVLKGDSFNLYSFVKNKVNK